MRKRSLAVCRGLVTPALLVAALAGLARAESQPVPALRRLPLPKVLYLAQSPNSEEWAELLRHNGPANVSFAPLDYGDLEFHHLCDKPLEERPGQLRSRPADQGHRGRRPHKAATGGRAPSRLHDHVLSRRSLRASARAGRRATAFRR